MSRQQVADCLAKLSDQRLMDLILGLARRLTVEGREAYEPGTEEVLNGPLLRRINEINHRLLAAASHLNDGERETAISMLMMYVPEGETQESRVLRKAWTQVLPHFKPRKGSP